jgi:hypothetical protein
MYFLLLATLMNSTKLLVLLILSTFLGYYNSSQEEIPNINVIVVPHDNPKVTPENNPKPKYGLVFTAADQYRQYAEKTVYGDVMAHSKQKPYGDEFGRRINVHETSHGITSDLRNFYQVILNKKVNAFYVLGSKAIILEESNIKMRSVTRYIPSVLRSYRYNLYFEKNIGDWDDMPSYIIDEWNSYILGSMSAVEDYNNGILNERVDAVSGCLDFSIYATCFAMAVHDQDPEYWSTYPQFKHTIKFLLIRAEKTFNQGLAIDNFHTKSQVELLNNLMSHPDASRIREFLKKEFDGIFVNTKK